MYCPVINFIISPNIYLVNHASLLKAYLKIVLYQIYTCLNGLIIRGITHMIIGMINSLIIHQLVHPIIHQRQPLHSAD